MAYYSPTWFRRLVKEDHINIKKYLMKRENDFRGYVDSIVPFVLWLDIGTIRERVINKNKDWFEELAQAVFSNSEKAKDVTTVINIIDTAYIETINAFANSTRSERIDQDTLEDKLTLLSSAGIGDVRQRLNAQFNKNYIITNVTKPNKSVMVIFPGFKTLDFGRVFKTALAKVVADSSELSDKEDEISKLSERTRFLDFVNANFKRLQNVGHIEVDVISQKQRFVKRGQTSPRLLQALVSIPENDPKAFQKLQLEFSKQTGQAQSRIKIRKNFDRGKLVFEMLVEHGLSVGIPESQKDNNYKSGLERAFSTGAGLTAQLRTKISKLAQIFVDLETSKTIREHIVSTIKNALTKKPSVKYVKETIIQEATQLAVSRVKLKNKGRSLQTAKPSSSKRTTQQPVIQTSNLVSLQRLLDASLVERVKQNMGTGGRRDVLNLRSGRFAESVQVERLSESRSGAITAFYSYMRNPYATFSSGGRQQYPRSRDPKLLISRSIRDLAQTITQQRLRAVLV